jgi:hypothetical protein
MAKSEKPKGKEQQAAKPASGKPSLKGTETRHMEADREARGAYRTRDLQAKRG